jgi:phospholipase A1
MTQLVVVPGIFGCSMMDSLHRIIWPPGEITEPIDAQTLVGLLMQDGTHPVGIIQSVSCVGGFYRPILSILHNVPGCTVRPFSYDWRKDIRVAAAALAAALSALPAEDIVLIGHSMGGLVVRWLLECGAYETQGWFGRVRRAVFVATPHLGAPLAVFEILGITGFDPIILPGWAVEALSADPATYAAGYQLLPSQNERCVSWTAEPGRPQETVYDALGAKLNLRGMAAARAVHDTLDQFATPPGIEYCLAYGTGFPATPGGVLIGPTGQPEVGGLDGDGTVPAWSSLPANLPAATGKFAEVEGFGATHIGILSEPGFLARLRTWVEPAMV